MATRVFTDMHMHQDVSGSQVQTLLDTEAAADRRLLEVDENVTEKTGLNGADHLFTFVTGKEGAETINPAAGAAHAVYVDVADADLAAIFTAEEAAGRQLVQRIIRHDLSGTAAKHCLFFVVTT